jgi:hypothetical protein
VGELQVLTILGNWPAASTYNQVMTTSGDTGLVSDSEISAESLASPERFSGLVDAYSDIIYGYLARRVGASMGEDLAAETFLRAFRARAGYRGSQPSALPWLYGIGRYPSRAKR